MILAKPYLTLTGAQKRAAFENAHSKTHGYTIARYLDGAPDMGRYCADCDKAKRYTWRIRKTKRGKTVN